jgi:hypothetical protein
VIVHGAKASGAWRQPDGRIGIAACRGQVGHPTFSFDPGVVDVGLRSGVADGQQEVRDHNVVKERT